jgi:DNA-binding LacI/PurR family transcriptional regulator
VLEAAVDGFVLWTTTQDDPVLDAVAATGRPAAIQGGPPSSGITAVAPDDRAAAAAIAEHMLRGARSPLVLSHPLDRRRQEGLHQGPRVDVPFPVTRARLSGFRDAVEAGGLLWSDVPVAVVARNSRDDGRRALEAVRSEVRPDVVIAMSDQLAAGAVDALDRSVRVSGWDDSDVAAALGISSVRQSLFDQGVACARIAAGLTRTAEAAHWELSLR